MLQTGNDVTMDRRQQGGRDHGNLMAEKRNTTGRGSVLPGYLHEIRTRDKEIKDGQEALPNYKI